MRLNIIKLLVFMVAVVWVLNASRPAFKVHGCLSGCSKSEENRENQVRVVSLNVFHDFPNYFRLSQRLELIAEEIIRLDADIVLLQEVPWTIQIGNSARYLAEKIGMNYVYQRSNGNRWTILFEEGEAILSKFPILAPGFKELKPQEGYFRHRIVLDAMVQTPLGEIIFYVTHLSNRGPSINLPQVKDLAKSVNSGSEFPAIVAGDFNASPGSSQIFSLTSTWTDIFVNSDNQQESFTCCIEDLENREAATNKRIDYIFLKPGDLKIRIMSAERVFDQPFQVPGGWLWASDHQGLMVDLGKYR